MGGFDRQDVFLGFFLLKFGCFRRGKFRKILEQTGGFGTPQNLMQICAKKVVFSSKFGGSGRGKSCKILEQNGFFGVSKFGGVFLQKKWVFFENLGGFGGQILQNLRTNWVFRVLRVLGVKSGFFGFFLLSGYPYGISRKWGWFWEGFGVGLGVGLTKFWGRNSS